MGVPPSLNTSGTQAVIPFRRSVVSPEQALADEYDGDRHESKNVVHINRKKRRSAIRTVASAMPGSRHVGDIGLRKRSVEHGGNERAGNEICQSDGRR